MSKKIFVSLFAFVFIAFFMTGCSASNPDERRGEAGVEKTQPETTTVEKTEVPQPVEIKESQAPVKVETIETEKEAKTETVKSAYYTVQLGAFKEISNVEKFEKIIKSKFNFPVKTEPDPKNNTYKVTVGKFDTKEEAYRLRDYCVQQGYKDAWVTEINK